eukprot:5879002-Alexandrium_andersonii.AAC.1
MPVCLQRKTVLACGKALAMATYGVASSPASSKAMKAMRAAVATMVDRGAARSRAQALAFRLAPREMDPEVHILVDRAKALRRAI